MSKLSIQLVTYFSSREIVPLIESLKLQTFQNFVLAVFENSLNQEESVKISEILKASGLKYELIIGERNLGYTAHNILFEKNNYPFVLVINPDIVVAPDYLEKCLAAFFDQKISAVTGLVLRWNGRELPTLNEARIDTAGLDYFCLGLIKDRWAGVSVLERKKEVGVSGKVFGVSGAVAMYRRSAVLGVAQNHELYDPTFFMYKEDVELAIRLNRAGFYSWYESRTTAYHKRGIKEDLPGIFNRFREEKKRSFVLRLSSYVNQWKIYQYHLSFGLGLKDLILTACHELLRSMLVFITSPKLFILAGIRIFKETPASMKRRRLLLLSYLERNK